ncbi:glycosyltransferase [Eggerthellaceae bacterium zg-887]|uniref:glycosyltransferase n=1 Tax=Xiamenia xianingshaonis TaxID=2682776 RepID=UPI00140CFDC3|nr:glycosyltransferase [Xiamenia xianingshaonis]NHM16165.1 glycosyltransferase [Xiamenia xianingshaonis]
MPQNQDHAIENKPRVSVIVPVKNAAAYLQECLDSILAQTMPDFEVLCIDNLSNDESLSILEAYAENDKRVHVLQAEGNAGTARNCGLDAAEGEYVAFVDADDFIVEQTLALALAKAQETDADIIVFAGRRFDQQKGELSDRVEFVRPDTVLRGVFSPLEYPSSLFGITNPGPWGKLYRRGHLEEKELRFESLPNAEDLSFTFTAIALAENIATMDNDLYRYRVNTGTGTEENKAGHPLCFLTAFETLKTNLENASLFNDLKTSFEEQLLSTTRYNVNTLSDDRARFALLDELSSNRFSTFGVLGRPQHEYESPFAGQCAQYLSEAIEQHQFIASIREYKMPGQNVVETENDAPSSTPDVSVIILARNAENEIATVVGDALEQDIAPIEVICVDAGSSDESLHIMTDLAQQDSRIIVHSQESPSLNEARSRGMESARGEYLLFVGCDRPLEPHTLEPILAKAQKRHLDMLRFCAGARIENETVWQGTEALSCFARSEALDTESHLFLFRRAFALESRIDFNPLCVNEDHAFAYQLLLQAQRVSFCACSPLRKQPAANGKTERPAAFSDASECYVNYSDMMNALASMPPDLRTSPTLENAYAAAFKVLNQGRAIFSKLDWFETGGLKAMASACQQALLEAIGHGSDPSRSELLQLQGQVSQQQREKDHLNDLLQKRQDEIATLNESVKRQSAENAQLEESVRNLQEQNTRLNEQIRQLQNEKERLQGDAKQLQESKLRLEKDLEKRTKQCSKEHARVVALEESNSYKIGRAMTCPVRKVKRAVKKISSKK